MRKLDDLWFHVIQQAFIDMMSAGKGKENKESKEQALKWLDLNNKEFLLTCDFANINPNFVIKIRDRILKSKKRYTIKTHRLD